MSTARTYRVTCKQVTLSYGELLVTANSPEEALAKGERAIEAGRVHWGKREFIDEEIVESVVPE